MISLIKKIFSTRTKLKERIEVDDEVINIIKKITESPITSVFDVGAHHGRYTDAIQNSIKKADLYLFEPFPKSFKILSEKYSKDKHVKVENFALSNAVNISTYYSNALDETNSLLPSKKTNSEIDALTETLELIQVTVSTIDSYCLEKKINNISLLKIDAQGNTLNVLKGAEQMLEEKRIEIIQCEVEFLQIYEDQALFHHVSAFLESFGYELYSVYNLHFDVNSRLSWGDAVYYKK